MEILFRCFACARGGAEAVAQRVPFVGAEATEHLWHGDLLDRQWMAVALFQLGQHPVANTDDALDKEPRHDCELVAYRLGFPQIDVGCLAAAHDIEQAWPVDQTR